jgi:hypothetical protein
MPMRTRRTVISEQQAVELIPVKWQQLLLQGQSVQVDPLTSIHRHRTPWSTDYPGPPSYLLVERYESKW